MSASNADAIDEVSVGVNLGRFRELMPKLHFGAMDGTWAWYTLAACILVAVILIIRIILRFYLRR